VADTLDTLIQGGALDVGLLQGLMELPEPFAPGTNTTPFWIDPHISGELLKAHLDPNVEAASRTPNQIDHMVGNIVESLGLTPGSAVLDLGCGPGLYAHRLAKRGMKVAGIDWSRRSIDYARQQACDAGLDIEYRCESYLALDDEDAFDAALLIYGDLCVLAPDVRDKLLDAIRRALRPGGALVLDVTTRAIRKRTGVAANWYASGSGFWRPGPHIVLELGFDWPEQSLWLNQYVVTDADSTVTVYRIWANDHTEESIRAVLTARGLEVESIWGDLTGTPLTDDSEWIGVLARR